LAGFQSIDRLRGPQVANPWPTGLFEVFKYLLLVITGVVNGFVTALYIYVTYVVTSGMVLAVDDDAFAMYFKRDS
jgi:hypothetical protein